VSLTKAYEAGVDVALEKVSFMSLGQSAGSAGGSAFKSILTKSISKSPKKYSTKNTGAHLNQQNSAKNISTKSPATANYGVSIK